MQTVKKRPDSRRREPPARAPLTRERIELAALELIDHAGLEGFSTRKLGERLGCEAMSIYHHFPSKAHLLDALVDRIVGGAHVPPTGLAPVERLRAICRGWRAMARAHPRFYPVLSVHRMNSEVGVAYLDEVVATIRATGLDREATARFFRSLGYFLMGAALDEIAGYARGPSSMNPIGNEELARRFPHIADAGKFFAPDHFDRTFELGLELMLRGAGLAPRRAGRARTAKARR